MRAVTRQAWTAYALAGLVFVLDQISKLWIVDGYQLEARGPVAVPGPMDLTWVCNRGVSFGLLHAEGDVGRWALVAFSTGVAIILALWVRKAGKALFASALGLIIGGALGNAIDRARYGCVADFLDFSELHFPWVFNIADAAINIGVVLLIIDALRRERAPDQR